MLVRKGVYGYICLYVMSLELEYTEFTQTTGTSILPVVPVG